MVLGGWSPVEFCAAYRLRYQHVEVYQRRRSDSRRKTAALLHARGGPHACGLGRRLPDSCRASSASFVEGVGVKRAICITGMHRSGTSLVARVCNLLGVDLGGEDDLMPPTPDNPRGYWESERISWFNERLLGRLGGNWKEPPFLESGWENAEALDPLRNEAREILSEHFGEAEIGGWKDPRMSFLLPFWRSVAPIQRTVLVLRDPREVAGSLTRRNELDDEAAAELWLRYTTAAWLNDPQRLLVTYDAFFDGIDDVTQCLVEHLRLPAPGPHNIDRIRGFFEPSLRHHRGHAAPSPGSRMSLAVGLFQAAREGRDSLVHEIVALLDESWKTVQQAERLERTLADRLETQQQTQKQQRVLEEHLQALEEQRDKALAENNDLRGQLKRERSARKRVNEEFARLRARRSVRLSLAVAGSTRPAFQAWRSLRKRRGSMAGSEDRITGPPQVSATPAEEKTLAERLRQTIPAVRLDRAPKVSIIMLNRNGERYLRRCLPVLAKTEYPNLELVVVDNASEDSSRDLINGAELPFRIRLVENAENRSFSQGNNQGAEAASGDLLLFLNNDVEPVDPSWLAHMVAAWELPNTIAVGARLVYPARPGLDNQGDILHPDLTLQHRGVDFTLGDGVPRGRNLGGGEDPLGARAAMSRHVPAVTAACMLISQKAFAEIGGFSEGYHYGSEDVDLCLKLRRSGAAIRYCAEAVLWHHEYGTQNAEGRERKRRNRLLNREAFIDQWGPQLFRQVLGDKVQTHGEWSDDPLHVGITLTNNDVSAGWGDWYTAHELGDALEELGWQVTYLERYRDRWYDIDRSIDAVIVLLDRYDLRRIPRHVVTIAWVRNWTDRWLSHPWFDDFDIVFASSETSKKLIEARSSKVAAILPLATNPDLFRPRESVADRGADLLFVGNYWKKPRTVLDVLPPLTKEIKVHLYGRGWEDVPSLAPIHLGTLPYEELPQVYASARLVLDDTAGPTKPYGAVNSRVFDALAAGTLVVSDNPHGIRELFDDEFPVFEDAEELAGHVRALLADPQRARELVDRYRSDVLRYHTYTHRAKQIRDALVRWCDTPKMGVHIGVPSHEEAPQWGDTHFARSLQRQLERAGYPTRVLLLSEWEEAYAARTDLVLHLFGLSELTTRKSQVNALWVISHPELVTREQCDSYDAVFAASSQLAERLKSLGSPDVHTLLQATDPDVFAPTSGAPPYELLFVGNSRGVRRQILDDLLPTSRDLAIYGQGWTRRLVDMRHVRGTYIPNSELAAYYSSAVIVLNDHWPDMRREGLLSNRLFDALAAGAFVISDHVDGIHEVFDGGVVTYKDVQDLKEKVDSFLADEAGRQEHAARGRAAVLDRHTFAHRVQDLLAVLKPLVAAQDAVVRDSVAPESQTTVPSAQR